MTSPLEVACPKCSVKPGLRCIGVRSCTTMVKPHHERYRAARDADSARTDRALALMAGGVSPRDAAFEVVGLPDWHRAALDAARDLEARARAVREAAVTIARIAADDNRDADRDGPVWAEAIKVLDAAGVHGLPNSGHMSW